ncbi:hypothetical protein QR680_011231 [Steinernema hermaphroditum]|uniref:Ferritin n=1 Tax=Steinernema hermaphroditum TaxID=289476 RepID=A0AA39IRJ2_9BILA|nr:hypothetical protein QR680_011231 [Steinernema hermaphroditum]
MSASLARQNYDADVEEAINNQINNELIASYTYLSMANHFARADIAMPGAQAYFMKQSMDEKKHAEMLMDYQVKRGGRVVLQDVMKPLENEWKNLQAAFKTALELERANNTALHELHGVVDDKADPDCRRFLQQNYLREQVNEIEEMARRYNHCRRVGDGLGEYLYDQELLEKARK